MNPMKQYNALIGCFIILSVLALYASSETYQYDANGNLIRDGSKCYQHNAANRLENVTNCAGTIIAQYWYDYMGRKIQALENGTTTYYPFPGFESRVNGSQLENTTYIYANGEIVARKDPNGSMHYYHGDQLGSTSVITDASGNLEEKTKYLPFGGIISGGTKTKYLYNGKELISATGLYDYEARPYNWQTMHFITPDGTIQDPNDPQTLNRYAYVRNNPMKYTDPSGKIIFVPFLLMAGVGILYECNYLSTHANPTLEGTLTEGVIGTTATGVGIASGGVAAGAGVGAMTTGAAIAGASTVSENVMRGEDASQGLPESMVFGAVAGKATQVAGRVISRFETVSVTDQQFSRYMSKDELKAVNEHGMLRGGKPGETYFTTDEYQTASSAQQKLSLDKSPEVKVDFKVFNNPRTFKGTVSPDNGQLGGGTEYWTRDQVCVEIYKVTPLKK